MKRFKGVLIASDYDGTLVPSHKRVTDKVRTAIKFFISEGGFFTVSTGRTYQGFHSFSPDIINAPVLLSNGAMAYDYAGDHIVFNNGIGDEGIPALRCIRDLFPDLSIEMYAFSSTYAINLHEQADRHFTSQNIPYQVVGDPSEARRPWSKVMLGGEAYKVAAAQEYLAKEHPSVSFLPTTGGYLEVLRPGVHKGTGLISLASVLGVSKEHIYAVGDGYNDVEMLQAASAAFVPANGDDPAKAAADYIVGSNEDDAVADVIKILGTLYPERH